MRTGITLETDRWYHGRKVKHAEAVDSPWGLHHVISSMDTKHKDAPTLTPESQVHIENTSD